MKKNLATNYGTLLNTNPAKKQDNVQDTPIERANITRITGNYKTVCYSIPPETAEKIRKIAAWDRKKINAVVTEAFEQYAAKWKPTVEEPPKF